MSLQELQVIGIGQAGNFLSAVERIKLELHRDRPVESDQIKLALITAMQFYSKTRFWFNEGQSSMMTKPDVIEYGPEDPPGSGNGYPAFMIDIDGVQVFQDPEIVGQISSSSRAWPMKREQFDTMRLWTDSSRTGTRPYWYAIHHDHLFIYPVPNARYRIRFDYLEDIERPRAQFVAGEWRYFSRYGAPITDDYSTPWLRHAEDLIRNRAKADMWANVFFEDARAQTARGQEAEALSNLKAATNRRLASGNVRPHFAGALVDRAGYPY